MGALGYRTLRIGATVYRGPYDSNSPASQGWRVPILSPSELVALRRPPASYPIANPTGLEQLDAFLPEARRVRYGGLSAGGDGQWDWLAWRMFMLWGTGSLPTEDRPSSRTSPSGTGSYTPQPLIPGAIFLGWETVAESDRLEGLTAKEQSFITMDDARGGTWLSRNPAVPMLVLCAAGGIAAAAAIAAGSGAAAAGGGAVATTGAGGSSLSSIGLTSLTAAGAPGVAAYVPGLAVLPEALGAAGAGAVGLSGSALLGGAGTVATVASKAGSLLGGLLSGKAAPPAAPATLGAPAAPVAPTDYTALLLAALGALLFL